MTTHIPKFGEKLTPREAMITKGIVLGRQTKQIARDLGISKSTVESHRAYIRAKLGARSAADIVRIALTKNVPLPQYFSDDPVSVA